MRVFLALAFLIFSGFSGVMAAQCPTQECFALDDIYKDKLACGTPAEVNPNACNAILNKLLDRCGDPNGPFVLFDSFDGTKFDTCLWTITGDPDGVSLNDELIATIDETIPDGFSGSGLIQLPKALDTSKSTEISWRMKVSGQGNNYDAIMILGHEGFVGNLLGNLINVASGVQTSGTVKSTCIVSKRDNEIFEFTFVGSDTSVENYHDYLVIVEGTRVEVYCDNNLVYVDEDLDLSIGGLPRLRGRAFNGGTGQARFDDYLYVEQ